ncbi:MAG TPA: DMT family transporter [Candidatus Saccharimonadales bacterium]|nr:DMT family transporter [Candidatus Saccharimonadales bacterium]
MRVNSSVPGAPSRPVIAVSIAMLMAIWAINFLVVKWGLRYLPALAFASFRVVGAGIFMLTIAPVCARLPIFRPPSETGGEKAGHGYSPRDFWIFFYLGFFGVAVNQLCFTIGLNHTNVTHSSIIVGLAPIYTLTLAVLLRLERLTLRIATGMTIAFSGVVILASSTGMVHCSPTLLGDAITMCGSLGFAMYVVLGKRVAGHYNALTMTTWNFIFGALIALPIAVWQFVAVDLVHTWLGLPWQAYACVAYTGLFSSTLAYLFYFWLLRYLEASQLASFSYLLPVSASALGILFLGEHGSVLELAGAVLALLGVYYIESTRR